MFGRKTVVYIFFTGLIIAQTELLLCAVFIDWPKEYILINTAIASSVGAEPTDMCHCIHFTDQPVFRRGYVFHALHVLVHC